MSDSRASKVIPIPEPPRPAADRLDSWKEIAAYLKRGARTVQRWEREERLPVHRLQHERLGSVYAFRSELDAWWAARASSEQPAPLDARSSSASVAVLPFADMSPEKDQAYFCEGIADEIIGTLSRVKPLQVSSRSSSFQFKSQSLDAREIGRRLRVATILEGSVRKSGDHLRITVQLVDSDSGYQIWSERYDRELRDIFAIQDDIAGSVVEALEVELSPHEAAPSSVPPTRNIAAYDCYLRGRKFYYQYGPLDMDFAVQLFTQAIALDPGFGLAYAGLADCWSYIYLYSDRSLTVREQADWASRKAVEMNPLSASAFASRGLSLSVAQRDEEAETAFETAVRLDPKLFEARYFYARHCFVRGQSEKALQLYEAACRVRPDDYQSPLLMAQIYDDLGRTVEARASRRRGIEIAENHLKLNPDDVRALYMAANGLTALGDAAQGREWARRAIEMRPEDSMVLYNVGCIYSMLGDVEDAIDCLVKAKAHGLTEKGWYQHDSNLDPLRSHPRFQALLDSLA
jgi:adenylate cyclase